MNLVETKITKTAVRMRYADHIDPAQATEWVDFQFPLAVLKHPANPSAQAPLGDPELQFLAEVHSAALRHMRDVIGTEIQRLSALIGGIR